MSGVMLGCHLPYHLVECSPYPLLISLILPQSNILILTSYAAISYSMELPAILFIALITMQWLRDIIVEALYQGHHTSIVQSGLSDI
jgi:hypothetical protein